MSSKFTAGQLAHLGRTAGAYKAGSICRVVKVLDLNSFFRYMVAPAMEAPGRTFIPAPAWEGDLSPVGKDGKP